MLHRSVSGVLFVLLHADLGTSADNDVSFKNALLFPAIPLTRQHTHLPEEARTTNGSIIGDDALNLVGYFESIKDFANMQYSGMIGLGTPRQQMSVILDTGSSDLWVTPSSFTSSQSSTVGTYDQMPQMTIAYGMGSVSGKVLTDELEIGGVALHDFPFCVLTTALSGPMKAIQADGCLGLSFAMLSHTGDTWLNHLRTDAKLTSFSLFLTATAEGSFLALGDPDPSWYLPETYVWAPTIDGQWAVQGSISVGDSYSHTGALLIDSGTSFITQPASKYRNFVETLLGDALETCDEMPNKIYLCPCAAADTAQVIVVNIGGSAFPVPPADFLAPFDLFRCVLQVMPAPEMFPIILGDTFLRGVLATFSAESQYGAGKIGLALRRDRPHISTTPTPKFPDGLSVNITPISSTAEGTAMNIICLFVGLSVCILVAKWRKPPTPTYAREAVEGGTSSNAPYQLAP